MSRFPLLLLLAVAALPAADVTAERLAKAASEPHNWLTYYGSYKSWRYSELAQIHVGNVKRLTPVWAFESGFDDGGMQSTPLVVDGVMVISTASNHIFTLDAATGRQLWRYDYPTPDEIPAVYGNWNRGVAIAHGLVFMGTLDNHLVAVDLKSGREVWKVEVEDAKQCGCNITGAPLIVKDMVVTGVTGGDSAHRGYLNAFDAKTGRHRWRFWTIPGPGEPGNETWKGDSWKYGGGSTWITGTYDPELDLLYWGVGNPAADFYGESRRGDNLYTESIIALDPDNGQLAWHYQQIPYDVWDYDSAYEIVLLDTQIDGKPRKILVNPNKSGYVWVLDRTTASSWAPGTGGEFQLDRAYQRDRRAHRSQRAARRRADLHLPGHRRRAQLEPRRVLAPNGLVLLNRPGVVPDRDGQGRGAARGDGVFWRRVPDGAPQGRQSLCAPRRRRPGHGQAPLAVQAPVPVAGLAIGDRRRPAVHRRRHGPLLCAGRQDRRGAVGVPHRLRSPRLGHHVLGERASAHRHAQRLGLGVGRLDHPALAGGRGLPQRLEPVRVCIAGGDGVRFCWALLLLAGAQAQTLDLRDPALIERGAGAFAKSCAVGYCHGSEGRPARGPALRDRNYKPPELYRMVHDGLPGTSMPAWKGILPNDEIWAITGYILSLGAAPVAPEAAVVDLSGAAAEPEKQLSAEARRGRELFFDLTRQKRCGLCHAIDGRGRAIGPNLAATLADKDAAAIRHAIEQPGAAVAFGYELAELRTRSGETITGVLADQNDAVVKIHDFAALPPPLRTVPRAEVRRLRSRNRSAMPGGWELAYSSAELDSIVAYLAER